MDCGETTARVIAANIITCEIDLELDRPIPPEQRRVTFTPRRKSRATYSLTSVIGTLSPAIEGVIPTAEIVVYPAHTCQL